jgi:hypothetical protein
MRRKIIPGAIATVAPVGVLVLILLSARTPLERRCIAALDPDTVAIQTTPVNVAYTVPDTIAQITRVMPPEDSGIKVVSLDALKRSVTLDVATATAADWTLNFAAGGSVVCAGTLTILQAR